jgi:hypothetical protein
MTRKKKNKIYVRRGKSTGFNAYNLVTKKTESCKYLDIMMDKGGRKKIEIPRKGRRSLFMIK